jgi:phytoene desaturase
VSKKPTAVIVGAGTGGLAVANMLCKSGWQVDVYEQHAKAGGRAGLIEIEGFRFDSGPSWYLMPEVFEHYFSLLDRTIADYITLTRLKPAYKVFYDYHDPITITATFAAIEPGADKQLAKYLVSSEGAYRLAKKYFLYNTFQSKTTLLQPEIIRHSVTLGRLLSQSLKGFVEGSFKQLPLQQILQYPSVFLATSPTKAPALYHLMSHLDFEQGVFYPEGGIYAFIEALQSVGTELGVRHHFNAPVRRIISNAHRATGIELENGAIKQADIVISNTDLHFSETQLLEPAAQTYSEASWKKRSSGPSMLLMYLGVSGKLPKLGHHNLVFMKAWQENFEAIFGTKTWPEKPSMYISKPSATDKTVAPAGQENVFVLVPLPAKLVYTQEQLENYAEQCLGLVAELCKIPDLKKRIVVKRLYGPKDFAQQLHAWQGSALGLGHTLWQSAFFRPANRSRKLTNLYYVGGDTQPGIGLPMCLISAELVYKYLTADRSAGPLSSLKPVDESWHV